MQRILIDAIPAEQSRLPCYAEPLSGDWWHENGTLHITVIGPDLDDEAFLIGLHEMIEARLCAKAGISQADVDSFDQAFTGKGEPGDDPAAPYRIPHRRSMIVEHLVAQFMGLDDYGTVS